VSDGVTLTKPSDKVAEADFNKMVSNRQSICEPVNSWTGRYFRGLVNSQNLDLKIDLEQLSNANFPVHCR